MKNKRAILILALTLVTAFSGRAFSAEQAEKNQTMTEETIITNEIGLQVTQDAVVDKAGETTSVVNGEISNNQVTENQLVESDAIIDLFAFSGISGIVSINQAPGSLNNQGNTVAVSWVDGGEEAFLHSQSDGEMANFMNSVDAAGSTRSNLINTDAFGAAMGIIGVNQSAGHMNNQNNAVGLSLGAGIVTSLSDGQLSSINTNNTALENGVTKIDMISANAFVGARGIISVNQSSGCMNNQSNVVNICINTSIAR